MKELDPQPEQNKDKKLSRRQIIKGVAALGGVAALPAMGEFSAKAEIEFKGDREPDEKGAQEAERALIDAQHVRFIEGLRAGDIDSVMCAALIVVSHERELFEIRKLQIVLTEQANRLPENAALQAGISNELIFLGNREAEFQNTVKQFREIPEVSEYLNTLNDYPNNKRNGKSGEKNPNWYSNI